MWISSFPVPFGEKAAPYPLSAPSALVACLPVQVRVSSRILCSVPPTWTSAFTPVLHCFDYCSFVVNAEIRKC